ncbi:MAG: hypothetical protein ACLTXH_10650 [Enterobacter hormaechei]
MKKINRFINYCWWNERISPELTTEEPTCHKILSGTRSRKIRESYPQREFIIEHLTKREKPANREELAVELNIEVKSKLKPFAAACRHGRDGQLSLLVASATRCQSASTC